MRNTNANALSAYMALVVGDGGCVIQSTKHKLQLNRLWLALRVRWNRKLQQLHISPSWTSFSALSNARRSVFAPLRRFDGQTLKGKITDAETKAKRLLISVERTREDNAKWGHGHVDAPSAGLGAVIGVKELVKDNAVAVCVVFTKKDLFKHDL